MFEKRREKKIYLLVMFPFSSVDEVNFELKVKYFVVIFPFHYVIKMNVYLIRIKQSYFVNKMSLWNQLNWMRCANFVEEPSSNFVHLLISLRRIETAPFSKTKKKSLTKMDIENGMNIYLQFTVCLCCELM